MNEFKFIIYDDENKIVNIQEDTLDEILNFNAVSLPCGYRYEVFNYIGLNDIDGKKIYADSSIVEFGIRLNNKEFQGNYILKGYFEYDNDLCCYLLKCLDIDRVFIFAISFLSIKNIKIIDTIQENNLGLIKDIK